MGSNSRTRYSSNTIQNIDDTRREPSLLDQIRQVENAQRCLLSSLHHNRIPASQCRSQFPSRHRKRIVPRNDLSADTDRLADRVCELRWSSVDDLAVDLICISAIVLQYANDLSHIAERVSVWFAVVPCLDRG
jgi:hypothetical protein